MPHAMAEVLDHDRAFDLLAGMYWLKGLNLCIRSMKSGKATLLAAERLLLSNVKKIQKAYRCVLCDCSRPMSTASMILFKVARVSASHNPVPTHRHKKRKANVGLVTGWSKVHHLFAMAMTSEFGEQLRWTDRVIATESTESAGTGSGAATLTVAADAAASATAAAAPSSAARKARLRRASTAGSVLDDDEEDDAFKVETRESVAQKFATVQELVHSMIVRQGKGGATMNIPQPVLDVALRASEEKERQPGGEASLLFTYELLFAALTELDKVQKAKGNR